MELASAKRESLALTTAHLIRDQAEAVILRSEQSVALAEEFNNAAAMEILVMALEVGGSAELVEGERFEAAGT